ncbi:MAG: putative DNA binding domain-containing protein [Propionibacteriaceae bacterium]|jgi:ATP-dependent DNA helicase RecG|nr:putative DNA binding domain-containing protein [Propionibacteriaceae bacterium]
MDVNEIVLALRRAGGDDARVEVKSANGGFPDTTASTLSAFANTPGGGSIIFGLAENQGFAATGVYDVQQCQKAVTSLARNGLSPAHTVTTEVLTVDGVEVVIATVPEADRTLKPVKVRKSGLAYLRQHDGDYPISDQEEQGFAADRGQPTYDEQPVLGASLSDLDPDAVAQYLSTRRRVSPILERMIDEDVLLRTGVIMGGHPTVAGLLALGIYPQQFFPNLGIQASFVPSSGEDVSVRSMNGSSFAGPIPSILEEAMFWVHRVTGQAIVANPETGTVTDKPTYPPIAVRELIANALIHRDFGQHALNQFITLKVTPDQMTIANPGGLFGLRVDSLGFTPSHLRNGRLAEICQYITMRDGSRVVERLGTGIPAVRKSLQSASMLPPAFLDQGVRFVATLFAGNLLTPISRSGPQETIRGALAKNGVMTSQQLRALTGLSLRQVSYALKQLIVAEAVEAFALDGRTHAYRLQTSG